MKSILGDYKILEPLGKGGFAKVFKVRHNKLRYVRAIKILNDDVESEDDPKYQTFLNECSMLLKIGNGCHPNIVRIYQPRLIENQAVVEMDYVKGVPLTKYIAGRHFINIDEVSTFIHDIVGAMAYCHEDIYEYLLDMDEDNIQVDPNDAEQLLIDDAKRNELIRTYRVIHNDLHSDNVMRRDYDGHFVLLDFGLAIQNDKCVKSSSRQDGAYEFMSPEKLDSDSTDKDAPCNQPESDVYSLGILIYQILAGQVPFPLRGFSERCKHEVYLAHKEQTPPPILPQRQAAFEAAHPDQTYTKDYPDWLEKLILRCLEKDPKRRYHNAKAILNDFNAHSAAQPLTPASIAPAPSVSVPAPSVSAPDASVSAPGGSPARMSALDPTTLLQKQNDLLRERDYLKQMLVNAEQERDEAKKTYAELRHVYEGKDALLYELDNKLTESGIKLQELETKLADSEDNLARSEAKRKDIESMRADLESNLADAKAKIAKLEAKPNPIADIAPSFLSRYALFIIAALLGIIIALGFRACSNPTLISSNINNPHLCKPISQNG